MDKDVLERYLAEGLSLEKIAARVRKHPSTVGYWVEKHGLTAVHRTRHAARGGLDRDELAGLCTAGMSIAAIASRLGVSKATVRHWLRVHGLRTNGRTRRRDARDALARGAKRVELDCLRHGRSEFVLEGRGYYRCTRCRSEGVTSRRRRVKRILVAEAGGACQLCGYDRCIAALEFHHVDPATKEFMVSLQGVTRSLARARAEAAKCVLLCGNCHAEVEAGVARLPPTLAPVPA